MAAPHELQPSSGTPSVSTEGSPATQAKMQGHYDDAQTMRRAISIGDVATLKAAASHLASDRWLPSLGAEWAAPLAAVRAAAMRASEVESVDAAAAALASIGTACAACHQSIGGPRPVMALSPPVGEEEPSMLAHQAAVDELWTGLITPDAEAWQRGMRSIASGSFVASGPEAQLDVRELHALASQGIDAPRERWEHLTAKLLSRCAHCHRLYGVRAGGPPGE